MAFPDFFVIGAPKAGTTSGCGAVTSTRGWRLARGPLLRVLQGGGTRIRPELGPDDRRELVAWFADDVRLLERLTGRSYDDWLADRAGGAFTARRAAGTTGSGSAPG